MRLEVGRARVVPHVTVAMSSFVHDFLIGVGQLGRFIDNRPKAVRCVHPLVTVFEKLDAVSRRYAREPMAADSFVRHYEDVAQIVRAAARLPGIQMTARELAQEMLADGDIARLPNADDPALLLADPAKRVAVDAAWKRIAPMFWGPRIELHAACDEIRDWLRDV